MDTLPTEIYGIIFSYLQLKSLGALLACSKQFNEIVKTDDILQYHREAIFKRWSFARSAMQNNRLSIFQRITKRIEDQNAWTSMGK